MDAWWNSLRLGTKLNIMIQAVLLVVLPIAHFRIMDFIQGEILKGAERRASVSADGVINGMNMLMETGMISDPDNRILFIKKMGASEDVKELRIIRAKQVQDQFGPGLPEEQAKDDMDLHAIETKLPQFKLSENQDAPALRTVVPFIVSTNFRGTNCLNCHNVEVGSVNGAASITLDLTKDFNTIKYTRTMLWLGEVFLQILLFFLTRWLIVKFTRPLVYLQSTMEKMQRSGSMENFVPIKLENGSMDEVGKLTATFNRMSDALRQSEESMKLASSIYESSSEAVLISDENNLIIDVNPAFTAQTGYILEEVAGKNPSVLKSGRHNEAFYRDMWQALLNQGYWQGELHDRRKDGSAHIKLANISILRHTDGSIYRHVAQYFDITDRKKAEDALKDAEERYRLALEAVNDGLWDLDVKSRLAYLSPRYCEITGYEPNEFIPSIEFLRSLILPEDQPLVSKYLGSHHREEIPSRSIEYRMITKSGAIKWVSARGRVIQRDADGNPLRMVGTITDITDKKLSEETIWKQANFDTLTGLPNRDMFHDRLEQETIKSNRTNLPLALLLIDLDQFKEVNDTLGHTVGDQLLQEAAGRIRDCVRESDTVARLGGDEFTVVLSELDDNSRSEDIAQKIISKLAEPYYLGDEIIYVSASIGITLYPNDASDIDTLIKHADQAMYAAKNKGRNRFSYFTPALQEAAQNRLRLVNDLRGALVADQFRLHFQPIVEMSTGQIHKAEALLRWQHPQRGMVYPMEFIPVAEETGLIVDIGNWVFKESARWVKRWNTQFANGLQISINKSPVEFLDRQISLNVSPGQFKVGSPVFAEEWLRELDELGLPGSSIVVEITEGLLLNAEANVLKKILKLRDAGIQVAIDDFGTGYSSLSYLKKFDIDYLKIDQSFIRHLEIDQNDSTLVEAIIIMAHKLGIKVIAEGVETEGQRNLLAVAGCDYAQGYLFSKPVPPEEFEKLLGL